MNIKELRKLLLQNTQRSESNSKFLSIKHAAEWLGVCDKTISREIMDGHLKSMKCRNKVLIPVSSLEAYVEARLR